MKLIVMSDEELVELQKNVNAEVVQQSNDYIRNFLADSKFLS